MSSGMRQLNISEPGSRDLIRKSQLAQFFTPPTIARFMAALFLPDDTRKCRLLDPGAGQGALSTAFLKRWNEGAFQFDRVELDAFEIDESLFDPLTNALGKFNNDPNCTCNVRVCDFIHTAADSISGSLFAGKLPKYTHAILNPPYKKIRSSSAHRTALRRAGIETVNLYSAFVALSLALLKNRGQLVAIIPRSFCNGPYYRPFREYVLERAAVRRIHLFDSRDQNFKDDHVLQENVIIHLTKGARQEQVTVSTSTDDTFDDINTYDLPFERIVRADDPERIIHAPASPEFNGLEHSSTICHSLDDLDIQVSTGPVVAFRLKEYQQQNPAENTVPMLYPCHFNGGSLEWPKADTKKPNAIQHLPETQKWLYPNGFYCVVRRFSSKEERRRIVANVVDPSAFPDAPALGFENHLNVFHHNKSGLKKEIAYGLSVMLNSTVFDEYFRRFSGHTQVNVSDLQMMRYPDRQTLEKLGQWAMSYDNNLTQSTIDKKIELLIE